MKTISNFMLGLVERLAEMFPGSDYQSRMERYISARYPQNAADIENLQRQYQYDQQREGVL